MQRLLTNADVIVATPGRLWEVINGDQDLARSVRRIKFLVVDEADRLLSEGHFKEVEEILNVLDREDAMDENGSQGNAPTFQWRQQRQTLVFSATFQRDLQQKLAGKGKSIGGDLMDKQESMEYLLKKLNFREEKPRFIDVNPISQMASGLKEAMVECAGTDKVRRRSKSPPTLLICFHRISTSTPSYYTIPTYAHSSSRTQSHLFAA